METIEILTEEIQLDQLLKWAGIIESGGQVRFLIEKRCVYLNDVLVTEKRKKIKLGDTVQIKDAGCWTIVKKQGE